MSNKIMPNGWALVKLGDLVVDPKKDLVDGPFGSYLKAEEYTDHGIPVLKIQNIKANQFLDRSINYISEEKAKSLSRHSFVSGDLIITKLGDPLGLCCKVPKKYTYGIIVADLMRLRPNNLVVNNQFLIYAINCNVVQDQFKAITKGTTRPRVNLTIVRDINLSLPPLPEQHRIVAKIEELFSSLDKGIESLKTTQQQLKVYRQAVLKWAFEGKLTNKDIVNGKLPDSWQWISFSDLIKISQNGLSKRNSKEGLDFKVLRLSDIESLSISYSFPRYIKLSKEESDKYRLYDGDLVCIRVNGSKDLVGRLVIIKEKDAASGWAFCDHFIRFSLDASITIAPFYFYYFQLDTVRKYVQENMVSSAGQNTVSQGTMRSLVVPLPPVHEQNTIVAEIESRLSVCDKIEETIEQGLKQAEVLRQSILKKAFEGRLVPQDPNDEPASVLLARIMAEREKNKPENLPRCQPEKTQA